MKKRNVFSARHLKKCFPRNVELEEVNYKQMLEIIVDRLLENLERKNDLYYFDGRSIRVVGTLITVKISFESDDKGYMEEISFRSRLSRSSPETDPAKKVTRLFRYYARRCDPAKLLNSVNRIFARN